VGASVIITGASFGATQGSSTVAFNGVSATPTAWSDTTIVVPVPAGATTGSVVVTVGGSSSYGVIFAVATSNLTLTGSLSTARMFQTSTLLDNGKVLIAGGVNGFTWIPVPSAELYDPASATFTSTGSLNTGRMFNTGTLLNNGQVLIVGGADSNWNNIGTTELYDPGAGTFSFTGNLNTPRDSQTATLLNNGKVLIVGGVSSNGLWITALAANSELYDPVAGTFSSTGSLTTARDCHTATLLNNGQVLIVGGNDVYGFALASAELYNPATGTFTSTGSLNYGRAVHTASLLNNGMVLIAGGYDTFGNAVANAELYNPATGTFTVTGSMNTPRYDMGESTLLSNGMVLIAGGQDTNGNTLASVELYDPAAGTFSVTGGMNSTRQSLMTTLLPNGQVLISAGMDYYANVLSSAELYQPSTLTPAGLVSIAISPQNPSIAVGTSQQMIATGTFSDNSTQTLTSAIWSSSAPSIATISNDASNYGNALAVAPGTASVTACAGSVCGSTGLTVTPPPPSITALSPNAGPVGTSVIITGTNFGATQGGSTVTLNGVLLSPTNWSGTSITAVLPLNATTGNIMVTADDLASNGMEFMVVPSTGVASPGSMNTARSEATANLLDNGTVLIAGGMDSNYNPLSSTEIYDPDAGTFTLGGSLNTARDSQTATLLNNGWVLVVGGQGVLGGFDPPLASAELYNPATESFSTTGSLSTARFVHTATLLNNGTVLAVGGLDANYNPLSSAEIYNPVAQNFTLTGSLNTARENHTATLLNNGMVLITGGDDNNVNIFASAELYNPATGTFSFTGSLNTARTLHTATLLNNGKVLIAGGADSNWNALASAEIYDPVAGTFSVTGSLNTGRDSQTATLLSNGQVLVAGGWDINGNALASLELYDPTAGTFTSAGSLNTASTLSTATLLEGGAVLFAGGMNNYIALASAELYQPSTLAPSGLVSIAVSPANPSVSAGSNQQFSATGTFSDSSTQPLASATWNSSDTSIAILSNDATDHGNANGVAQGTATVSACTGSICGSTTLTVGSAGVQGPSISSMSPNSGAVGAAVTITGANFGATQGGSTVTFDGTAASVTTWSSTQIATQVPLGATSGNVVVTVYAGPSNGVPFTVVPTPIISGLSPTAGWVGTAVTISGTDFGWEPTSGTVTFNGVASTPTQWGDQSITAPVPVNATSGNVVVTVAGVASNPVLFTVPGGPVTNSPMTTDRWGATATLLNNGMVLMAGGENGGYSILASAELYDPVTRSFAVTGDLNTARAWQTASLLNNGQVLIAGGGAPSGTFGTTIPLASAELYDPTTGGFTSTASMSTSRSSHTATVLNNGKVLIIGGLDSNSDVLSSAELFDPAAGTFAPTGSLNTGRYSHTATLLDNGMVLITGGFDSNGNLLSSAELYDPTAGTFSATGALNVARYLETATLLNNGQVLIAGGWNAAYQVLASTESYDPGSGTFTVTASLGTGRQGHAAALLNNGTVMVTGGWDANNNTLGSTEIYDPVAGTFSPTGGLNTPRGDPLTTLLPSGQVLIAGGMGSYNIPLGSAELYQPATLTPPNLVSIAVAPANPSITAGVSQRFTATGTFSDNSTQTLASATWSSSANAVASVTSDVSNFGAAFGVAQGSATVSACTGTICGTTTLTVGPQTPLPPVVDGLAPGSAMVGSWVAISGGNFGTVQGSSTVTFGGTAATIVSWSDTAIFATVPGGLTVGQSVPVVVTTTAGASNPADFLPVSTSAAFRVSPQEVNLLVGQTRSISVMDSSGNALTGLEWSISDPSVAALSTDDPPIITAVAPGTAVVYVVGMPILVTVYSGASLPAGAPIWSAPVQTSSLPASMVPAVPSSSGADLFVINRNGADTNGGVGSLSAFGSDGSTVWSTPISMAAWTQIIPDFSGNALVHTPYDYTEGDVLHQTHIIQRVDPSTHQLTTLYTFSDSQGWNSDNGAKHMVVPHPSGLLFILDQTPANGWLGCSNPVWGEDDWCQAHVTLLNPTNGQQVATVTLEASTFAGSMPPPPTQVGQMIVAGDGNAYVPYAYTEYSGDQMITHARLLRFSTDGTSNKINLGDWTLTTDCTEWDYPPAPDPSSQAGSHCTGTGTGPGVGSVITNADTGVAVFATVGGPCGDTYSAGTYSQQANCPNSQLQLTLVSSDAITAQFNSVLTWNVNNSSFVGQGFMPALQREDGSYIGADGDGNLFAIGLDGSVVWQQQIGTAPPGNNNPPAVTPLYATADGGAIVTSTSSSCSGLVVTSWPNYNAPQCNTTLGTLYTVDQNGNVTSQAADTGAVYSWADQSYADSDTGLSQTPSLGFALDQGTLMAEFGGNPSQNGAATALCPCLFQSLPEGTQENSQNVRRAMIKEDDGAHVLDTTPVIPTDCPLCSLPSGSCISAMPGTGSTFLLLAGDGGLPPHNLGNTFAAAAQTEAYILNSEGHKVIACRVSRVEDFDNALLGNLQNESLTGQIGGGVIYFGHSGTGTLTDNGKEYPISALFVGEQQPSVQVPNPNLTFGNLDMLGNVTRAYTLNGVQTNMLGGFASLWLNGCRAGLDTYDSYQKAVTSIAKGISIELSRPVYAYEVGTYTSAADAADDQEWAPGPGELAPQVPPIYTVPAGPPGHKPGYSLFVNGQRVQKNQFVNGSQTIP
jgi:hypothetical protein